MLAMNHPISPSSSSPGSSTMGFFLCSGDLFPWLGGWDLLGVSPDEVRLAQRCDHYFPMPDLLEELATPQH
jgi:hypothetical protein